MDYLRIYQQLEQEGFETILWGPVLAEDIDFLEKKLAVDFGSEYRTFLFQTGGAGITHRLSFTLFDKEELILIQVAP